MFEAAENIYDNSKKSLDSLLREKAYLDVQSILEDKGININDVSDEDVENLVAAKVEDMMNGIKGFGVGTAFAIAVSLITGI